MSDDQERTHILKMGVKEWAHSFFFLVSEIWAKLKKLVSVEHVGLETKHNFVRCYFIH